MLNDTIAAISTPLGEGGIAVIRVSGEEAVPLVDRIFKSKNKLADVDTHTVHYGHIIDAKTSDRIEEVLVTVMRAPRSFTMEDVVEVSCHGGIVSVKKVLDELLAHGVRLAEPGEFTKRAFLNGRIDLTQAEAVIDLIRAKSDRAFKVALKQVDGALSKRIGELRYELVELIAHIEVNIDYPEHDVEEMTNAFIREKCTKVMEQIKMLLHTAEQGKILREGITTAIIGRPNVGKSSLLNALAQDNRAIVTDIPGTTRDVIEEYVNVGGIPLKLLDTAGIRETSDLVEQIGVERSRNAIMDADLVLFVLNQAEALTAEDMAMMEQLKDRQTIVILNKVDLAPVLDRGVVAESFQTDRIVELSLLEEKGLADLEKTISTIFFEGQLEGSDLTYVSNVRHIHLLKEAKKSLEDAQEANDMHIPIDMLQIDIRTAWEQLGEIIGDSVAESLIDQIFSQFCLGK
ncbi:tRNA uridine-5-carboxymethylaminomethyl(34) synthesis GTPase MnmE [Paenibacillus sp. N1-5-1-14]|uniref:tRNA uridine-5-carboxymethylaminomethyl(34) synthesis GTPase MnmE n=1 Tax=Paenibacillus radicibacter TaxID=2972488 RepID=UPI002158D8EA|nr:tRNA uridine-5-carboxymethylaminomethyl(34) synthesis GTPase MnmE [Paenibacillus radicibacter]MCR8643004.1 tRNA uridine-5-carboxymethylaminomethyl(34) synthesis GTPase MnmE [Paenibacillus radicibacter]